MDEFNILDKQTLETWFIARLVYDVSFCKIITKDFDPRWLKSKTKSKISTLLINFANKYSRSATLPELTAILKSALAKETNQLDATEIGQLLNDTASILTNCKPDLLFDITSQFVKRQAAWCAIIDNVNDIEKDPDATVDKCLTRLNAVQTLELTPSSCGFDYFNEEDYNEHYASLLNPDKKISTGWDTLDMFTHGGVLADGKSLYLFIGQAGLGKSLFLSNLAVNFLKQEKTVVVISLEMSQHVYGQRFDAHISGIDINQLSDNENAVKARINSFKEMYPKARLFIKEFPPRSISTAHIERYLTELVTVKGVKIDVLLVDYLNLVLPTSNAGDNMYKDGLDVSEKLRALSYKYNMPVVTACQVNTAGMNNDHVGMENIAESRGIAHTADFIVGLFQTDQDRNNSQISTRILKNRLGGEVGKTVPFKLNASTLALTDIGSAVRTSTPQPEIIATDALLDDIFAS